MPIIDLSFFQRYQGELDTAIKNYVKGKNPNEKGTSIPSGTNLNDLTAFGTYYIADDTIAGGLTNLPLTYCGKILVSDNGNNGIVQFYFPNHSPRFFQRLYWSNAWSGWVEYSTGGGGGGGEDERFGIPANTVTDFNDATFFQSFFKANSARIFPFSISASNQPITASWGYCIVYYHTVNTMFDVCVFYNEGRFFNRVYDTTSWGQWSEYAKKPVYLTQTLTAGQTSVTFNSADITSTSLIDVYTSVAGLGYTSMTGSVGTVTVVYEAQSSDITVTLEIKPQ